MLVPSKTDCSQQRLRKLILAIRDDESFSQEGKNQRIQRLMIRASKMQIIPSCEMTAALDDDISVLSAGDESNEQLLIRLEPNLNKECPHYVKNCSGFYFSCCNTIDPCHRCHLERGCCEVRPPQIATVSCNACGMRQPPGITCVNTSCGNSFSNSHCDICMVWTQSEITHCVGCGLCRVGAADTLYHCTTCEACFNVAFKSRHRCAVISMKDQRCPLCLEPTHSSQKISNIMRCGHVAHSECLNSSFKHGEAGMIPRCPSCRKCLFSPEQMAPYWEAMRVSINMQPLVSTAISIGDEVESPYGPFVVDRMYKVVKKPTTRTRFFFGLSLGSTSEQAPPPVRMCFGRLISWKLANGSYPTAALQTDCLSKSPPKVLILCYDCEKKCKAPFHYVGFECQACKGFNTVRV